MRERPRRPISLRRSLLLLVLICVLPPVGLLAFESLQRYRLYERQIDLETQRLSANILADVERELTGIESGLRVLSTSTALQDGQLARFHAVAKSALRTQIAYNYLLTNRDGHQVLNTFLPFGAALPTTGTPPELAAVFSERRSVLTNFFIGPVTGKPAIAMGVPVTNPAGEVLYSLNVGLHPGTLSEVLKQQPLPEGWVAALIDRSGTIIARNRGEDQFVGTKAVDELFDAIRTRREGTMLTRTKEGELVFSAFATSPRWQWAVAVGAPKRLLDTELRYAVLSVSVSTAVVLLLAGIIVFRVVTRLTESVRALNDAAAAMHSGRPVQLPRIELQEAEAIGRAIVHASELASEVHHRAYHDALTDLANRQLFFEFLNQNLARALRSGEPFSLLLLDLDKFKEVNDREGHAAGDALLKVVAERLRQETRAVDLAARLGGDEFALLLADADRATALEVAQRLCRALALPYPGSQIPVSASIGVVTWHAGIQDGSEMLEMADKAMYQSKEMGRNTVVEASHPNPAS